MEGVKSESAATNAIRSAKSKPAVGRFVRRNRQKSSGPESARSGAEMQQVGGSARGANPFRFVSAGAPQSALVNRWSAHKS